MANVFVMPFKVDSIGEKSHRWLGRSISMYLSTGLELNNIHVMPDSQTVSVLESHAFDFPYVISRAALIYVAVEYKMDTAVWGEIDWDGNEKSSIYIRSHIIDLNNYSQKQLPIVKGSIHELYRIGEDLLKEVMEVLKPGEKVLSPCFDLNPRAYEVYIKSLLIKDVAKKIEFLSQVQKTFDNSDFLNFELAESYFEQGNYAKAEELLGKIAGSTPNPVLADKKIFLKALIDQSKGNTNEAVGGYLALEKREIFPFEVHYNLGVLYAGLRDFNDARFYFENALKDRQDPDTWYLYVSTFHGSGERDQMFHYLNRALVLFPEDEKLLDLFCYFLSLDENRDMLFKLFEIYNPDIYLFEKGSEAPKISFKPINPFREKFNTTPPTEVVEPVEGGLLKDLENGNYDIVIKKLEGMIAVNPFIPSNYTMMSGVYLKKGDFIQAEVYGLGAVFLDASEANFLNLANVYEKAGKKEKAEQIRLKLTPR